MDRPAAIEKLAGMLLEKESRATEVARLLHDEVGQTLSAVGFHLQAMAGKTEAAAEVQGYLEQVIQSVRKAQNQLLSNVVERSGLPLALELLVRRMREESGFEAALEVESTRRFPAPVGFAVYRVVELALDNVRRHAGVNTARIRLTATEAGLAAEIRDSGKGFEMAKIRQNPPGTGLILMEAYAERASLHLRIDSTRRRGTIIGIQTFQ